MALLHSSASLGDLFIVKAMLSLPASAEAA